MADSSRAADANASRPAVAATPARQGRLGRHMFWVLVAGTALAALGLFLAWTWKAPDLSSANTNVNNTKAQAARAFNAPEPAAVIPPPASDHTAP